MPKRTLRVLDESGHVNLPKDCLKKDGLVEDGVVISGLDVDIERLDERAYLLRVAEDPEQDVEEFPEVRECEVIQRAVARELQRSGAFDVASNARAD